MELDDVLEPTIEAIEAAIAEDARSGLALAHQNPIHSTRYWSAVANGLRILGRYEDSEKALCRGLDIEASPFDVADAHATLAQLQMNRLRWAKAFEAVEAAITPHVAAGPTGLPGPPDRGLPMVLIVRGTLNAFAHDQGCELGSIAQAQADFLRVLELIPDPRKAPFSHLSAVHNLALLTLDSGRGLTFAQDKLWHVGQRLRDLGIHRSSPIGARVLWARAVVDWVLFGSSHELGRRFVDRIERALKTAHRHLRKSGAVFDALLVALDLGLLYLENRRFLKSGRKGSFTEPDPRWDDLRELTLEAFQLDWAENPEVAAAVVFWRQASLEEKMPPGALELIYGKVRGLRKPDPNIHAHGERWGGGLQPDAQSAVFQISQTSKCSGTADDGSD